MNDRDHLRQLAADIPRLQHAWRELSSADLADGYPSNTPGNGTAGVSSNSISDPTANAAAQRAPKTANLNAARRHARNMADLTRALWAATRGDTAPPAPMSARLTIEGHLAIVRLGAESCARIWQQRPAERRVLLRDDLDGAITPETVSDALSALWSHHGRLCDALRLPTPDQRAELSAARCIEGTLIDSWARPCEALAVRDGLCSAGYQRRRRWEIAREAA